MPEAPEKPEAAEPEAAEPARKADKDEAAAAVRWQQPARTKRGLLSVLRSIARM